MHFYDIKSFPFAQHVFTSFFDIFLLHLQLLLSQMCQKQHIFQRVTKKITLFQLYSSHFARLLAATSVVSKKVMMEAGVRFII